MVDRLIGDIREFTGFTQAHGFAVENYVDRASLVASLLGLRGPPTIVRRVVSININAIKAHAIWTFTHVLQKCRERIEPALTYANSSAAIMFECRVRIDAAPPSSAKPRFVGSRRRPSACPRVSMLGVSDRCCRIIQASTIREIRRLSNDVRVADKFNSAVASKQKSRAPVFVFDPPNRSNRAKSLSRNVSIFSDQSKTRPCHAFHSVNCF